MTESKPLVVAIVVGEHSGDMLGASLIQALKSSPLPSGYDSWHFVGIAGPRMQRLGCEAWYDMEELAVMGLVEVLGRIRRLFQIRADLVKRFTALQPDVFVGIDAPDFTIGLAARLKNNGLKTVHYVCPSVWAWRQKRVFKIKKAVDRVLALLPFEKQFLDKHDVPCTFVGHTLADEIPIEADRPSCRLQLQTFVPSLDVNHPILAVLPGSRHAEVELLCNHFLEAYTLLHQENPLLQCVIPVVNEKRRIQVQALVDSHYSALPIHIVDGQARLILQSADAALMASGTATLEAMLCKVPMVVAYRLKPMTYHIVKHLIKLNYFSLPNVLTEFFVNDGHMPSPYFVPELLQNDVSAKALVGLARPLLHEQNAEVRDYFTQLHQRIRRNASEQAAAAILREIRR